MERRLSMNETRTGPSNKKFINGYAQYIDVFAHYLVFSACIIRISFKPKWYHLKAALQRKSIRIVMI
jgi:hypothetical protein